VGQVVIPFDPIEESEAIVEIGNDSKERDIGHDMQPEIEPAAGQNLESSFNLENNHDQDND
jgi:hypothetical protein